jgi:hypothetical protein
MPCRVPTSRDGARSSPNGAEVCEHRPMLSDAGDEHLEPRTGGIPCPRCGRLIVLLVGKLGPCEVCMGELAAEREARRAARAEVRPCGDGCGLTVTGQATYATATCRMRAWRARQGVVAAQ